MAKLNKYQRQRAEEVREILVANFPLCFMPKGEPKKPLAIGLHVRIQDRMPELSRDEVAWAMQDYTSGATYLKAMVAGAARLNLDGEAEGAVDEEAAAVAARRLQAMDRVAVIRAGVIAMKAALPILQKSRDQILFSYSALDNDGNEIPDTLPPERAAEFAEYNLAIDLCQSAIKQGEACL